MGREIEIFPSRILQIRSRSLRQPDSQIAQMLRESIPDYAVGLAAPQIGISRRAILWRQNSYEEIVWNPVYKELGGPELGLESCLSLPGETFVVPRWTRISFSGRKENWEPFQVELEGWPARVIQHEVDHLDGILISDRGDPYQENEETEEESE